MPSLVVSFGQPFEARRVGLASDDVDRVVAAIDDAVSLGARRVILCGWSFGAAICLAAARMRPQAAVGAVLVSPMISLAAAAFGNARRTGRSRVPVAAALMVLRFPLSARWAGVRGALSIRALSRGVPHGLPVLALHSTGDRLISTEATRLARDGSELMTLVELPDAAHCLEWNRDARQFQRATRRWIAGVDSGEVEEIRGYGRHQSSAPGIIDSDRQNGLRHPHARPKAARPAVVPPDGRQPRTK